jgi:hypothetical protein
MIRSAEFSGAVLGNRSRASTSAQRSAAALCTHAYRIDHPNSLHYREGFESKKISEDLIVVN